MRLNGGVERWMVLLPMAAMAVFVTVYVGGPDRALYLSERFLYGLWDQAVLLLRH
ncbi:MAG TPA: hypothetical protein VF491_12060 [Vicinamibacterales bacterium]|jgi:hypothetical protein